MSDSDWKTMISIFVSWVGNCCVRKGMIMIVNEFIVCKFIVSENVIQWIVWCGDVSSYVGWVAGGVEVYRKCCNQWLKENSDNLPGLRGYRSCREEERRETVPIEKVKSSDGSAAACSSVLLWIMTISWELITFLKNQRLPPSKYFFNMIFGYETTGPDSCLRILLF